MRMIRIFTALMVVFALPAAVSGQTDDEADRMAQLAAMTQNPLASIAAIVSDNTFNFKTGNDDETAYSFQLQGMYSLPTEKITYLPRVIVPIIGAPAGASLPWPGEIGPETGTTWGMSDLITQLFITPNTEGSIKWGIGPQVSLKTRTSDDVGGAGWGGGLAGVLVTSGGNFSFAGIIGNMWGEDSFNTFLFQPMTYYNFPQVAGLSLSYQGQITADWSAKSSERWTVPIGLQLGKLWDLGGGYALDVSGGPYYVAGGPESGPDWQFKLIAFLVFPR